MSYIIILYFIMFIWLIDCCSFIQYHYIHNFLLLFYCIFLFYPLCILLYRRNIWLIDAIIILLSELSWIFDRSIHHNECWCFWTCLDVVRSFAPIVGYLVIPANFRIRNIFINLMFDHPRFGSTNYRYEFAQSLQCTEKIFFGRLLAEKLQ